MTLLTNTGSLTSCSQRQSLLSQFGKEIIVFQMNLSGCVKTTCGYGGCVCGKLKTEEKEGGEGGRRMGESVRAQ